MRELFKIVKIIAAFHGKSNPVADKMIEEKLARGENIDVKSLFDLYNLDIEDTNKHKMTALQIAAQEGFNQIVTALIDAGADVNVKNSWGGETALHLSISSICANINVTKVLISAGADINAQTEIGYTALHHAARNGAIDTVIALIEAGAILDIQAVIDQTTPLQLAAGFRRIPVVIALIEAGANFKDITINRKPLLTYAGQNNEEALALALLKRMDKNSPEVQDFIKSYLSDPNSTHFTQLPNLSREVGISFYNVLSIFQEMPDIDKCKEFIQKNKAAILELEQKNFDDISYGDISYNDVRRYTKMSLVAKEFKSEFIPVIDIINHIMKYDHGYKGSNFVDSIKKSRKVQPAQSNSL